MIIFPNCKVNIGLRILGRRPDGYHNIETIFYPLPLYDALEILPLAISTSNRFDNTGLPVPGDSSANLCLKAHVLLKQQFPSLPPVHVHLHKTIPAGAGLGGGSADAAAMLLLLNDRFELGLSHVQLEQLALQLGSDCPFFIRNETCYATGRGEQLEAIQLDLSNYQFIIVNPGLHISTAEAFSLIRPQIPANNLKELIFQPITTWQGTITNDFEKEITIRYPVINDILRGLKDAGAIYASMSGTGSTVFGIFEKNKRVNLSFPASYFVRELTSQLK